MVRGSIALNFYSQPRMTRDVDLVIELSASDAARLVALFGDDFSCDEDEIREAIARKRIFNLIHFEKVVKLDFIVRKDEPFRREEFARRRRLSFDGFQCWVVSPEDLIPSKLVWAKDSHPDFQLRDVRNLLASVAGLDLAYLDRWAAQLEVAELLAEVKP